MLSRTAALFVLLVAGCAGPQREVRFESLRPTTEPSALFVGHSIQGDVVVAASHYDAMTGVATTEEDLGLRSRRGGDGQMMCQREMPTGTHVPLWTCRYVQEVERIRQEAQDWLRAPQLSVVSRHALPTITTGNIPGGGRGGMIP